MRVQGSKTYTSLYIFFIKKIKLICVLKIQALVITILLKYKRNALRVFFLQKIKNFYNGFESQPNWEAENNSNRIKTNSSKA